MSRIFREGDPPETVESEELDEEKIKALSDGTRRKILEILAEEPSYPLEVARELGIEKQKAYYHFQKLEDAGLVEKDHEEKVSGGSATFYAASAPGYLLDLGTEGDKLYSVDTDADVERFLSPLVEEGEIEGHVIVGSPEEHGPDRVQALDGHLAGEIGAKLGNYGVKNSRIVKLDTEVHRDSSFSGNLLMIGGILTNTVTKKFNEEFPVSFEGEEFPYREISTPENKYSEGMIGVIAKTENPVDPESSIFIVAGVQNSGTEAAVLAFKNLENLVEDYGEGDFYQVVRGLDLDGDGEVDDFEVVE